MVDFSTVKVEKSCRFCKNKENKEISYLIELNTEEEVIAREKAYDYSFICDTCKGLIKEIISDAL